MISLQIAVLLLINLLHPFHVSVCDVVVNSEARAIQISQRIFVDDFEQTLNNTYDLRLIIDDENLKDRRDSLISLYLSSHLEFFVNDKKKTANYLGSEFEEDGIWCYVEIENVKKVKEVRITSKVLLDEFDDQANIIHFRHGDYERSVKLDENEPTITFTSPIN